MIRNKPISKLITVFTLLALTLPLQAEQISVDREEYENLKKAVEY